MLLVIAKTVLIAVALYFLLLGSVALFRPANARRFLLGFAQSAPKHYAELVARLIVGGAMLLVARYSTHLMVFTIFGWILIATTAVMAVVPWRIHRSFAEGSVPKALQYLPIIGTVSLLSGGALMWAIFTASAA